MAISFSKLSDHKKLAIVSYINVMPELLGVTQIKRDQITACWRALFDLRTDGSPEVGWAVWLPKGDRGFKVFPSPTLQEYLDWAPKAPGYNEETVAAVSNGEVAPAVAVVSTKTKAEKPAKVKKEKAAKVKAEKPAKVKKVPAEKVKKVKATASAAKTSEPKEEQQLDSSDEEFLAMIEKDLSEIVNSAA